MKHVIYILVLVAVTIGSTYFGFWTARDEVSTYVYKGEVDFSTQSEYSEFKKQVSQEGVAWELMDILSSDPPIVGHFKVKAPYGTTIDYGEVHKDSRWPGAIVLGLALLALTTTAFYARLGEGLSRS